MSTIRETVENELGGVTIPEQYEGVVDRAIAALEQRERQIRIQLTQEAQAVADSEEVQAAFDRVGLAVSITDARAQV